MTQMINHTEMFLLVIIYKVDAIVNSVGGDFDLSEGALSSSILEAAGDEIQEELLLVKSPDVCYGQVTTTKGHDLSCSFVFHGVLEEWNDDDAKEVSAHYKWTHIQTYGTHMYTHA